MGIYRRLAESIRAQVPVCEVTVVQGPQAGRKVLVFAGGQIEGDAAPFAPVLDQIVNEAQRALHAARSQMRTFEAGEGDQHATLQVFLASHVPPPWLIIVGAGHTSIPLASFGKLCGFKVTLIDARAAFANRLRFKDPDEILVEWPHEAVARLPINESTHVAVLTHDAKFEEPLLPLLLRSNARYIGVIGSRKTQLARRERLLGEGFTEADLARLAGPIGLDIGAVTPEEIALSIMAEIVARQHERPGGFLAQRLHAERR
jgi:xanthine dehydrogenase accessory factor